MAARLNYRRGVREKCFDCIHDDGAPGTRVQQVSACPALDCPLWPMRPITRSRWPMALVDSIVSTLGMSREDVLAWADNPHAKPHLPEDFRHGETLPRATHPLYGPRIFARLAENGA